MHENPWLTNLTLKRYILPCALHEGVRKKRGIAPLILNFCIIEMNSQRHAPAALSPMKSPRFLLDRMMCGPTAGLEVVEENISVPTGNSITIARPFSP
jgi:hypothetical protein